MREVLLQVGLRLKMSSEFSYSLASINVERTEETMKLKEEEKVTDLPEVKLY